MPYYATIDEDLARAKEILEKGKMREEDLPTHVSDQLRERLLLSGGHIFGADIFAAYKLLQSFVAEIEARGSIIELYERQLAKREAEKRQG